jgi:hypothetical protein
MRKIIRSFAFMRRALSNTGTKARMRLRVARLAAFAVIALGSLFGFGERASADVFDFTFSCGAGCGISGGVIDVVSGNITSIAGTATGLSSVGLNGAFDYSSNLVTDSATFSTQTNYDFQAATNNGLTPLVEFILLVGANNSEIITYSSPTDNVYALGTSTAIQVSATPLPAALPLFTTGLGALGLLGWRRKRKSAAAA